MYKILKCCRNVYNKYIFFLVMSSSNIFYWVEIAAKIGKKKNINMNNLKSFKYIDHKKCKCCRIFDLLEVLEFWSLISLIIKMNEWIDR